MFLGAPGAGKGTQAEILSREARLAHVSTGDLLRAAAAAGTPLGREADGHIRAGRLVPDGLVLALLRDRLDRPDARAGFILDGFPRNRPQAEALATITPLDAVVWFELPSAVLVDRLAGRRVCTQCGTVYNVSSRPPRTAGRCDRDGAGLVQRPDDRPEAVTTRLKVYADQTAPLLEYYRGRGLVRSIDAAGTPEDVTARLRAVLEAAAGRGDAATSPPRRSPGPRSR